MLILTTLTTGAALAHEGAHRIIPERMTAIKNMAQEMKAIGEILQGKVPFARLGLSEAAQRAGTDRP
jgi:cytochrome c556